MTKKLALNRETLRRLNAPQVRTVVGAMSNYCDSENCDTDSAICASDVSCEEKSCNISCTLPGGCTVVTKQVPVCRQG